jgi:hypothetical protein
MNAAKKPSTTKKPRVTVTKGVRLTEDEVEHVGKLLPQYPECASEAELLRQATLIGLYVLAAQTTGQPAYGGYQPDELVALLKYRVLPAIDFLFEHDAFPALYGLRAASSGADEPPAPEARDTTSTQIVAEAADELGDLGTGFMDD